LIVSLVKRGANRVPFRITKSEDEPMPDLYKVGRSLFAKSESAPKVVALIVKAEIAPAMLSALAKACEIERVELQKSDDGVGTLVAKGADLTKGVIVKLDENVAAVVAGTNLKKSSPRHIINGFGAAQREFDTFSKEIVAKAESSADARDKVSKASEEFNAYVALISANLPESVFKAEQVLKAAKDIADGDVAAKDPEMPGKDKAKKADAGKNGTGAGFELGSETGGDQDSGSRPSTDANDEDINAKPGARVSGDNSGLPARAKAPTKKAALSAALAALAAAIEKFDGDGDEDDANVCNDESTNGARAIPTPAQGESPHGEGRHRPRGSPHGRRQGRGRAAGRGRQRARSSGRRKRQPAEHTGSAQGQHPEHGRNPGRGQGSDR
jgi:hypothetical protein